EAMRSLLANRAITNLIFSQQRQQALAHLDAALVPGGQGLYTPAAISSADRTSAATCAGAVTSMAPITLSASMSLTSNAWQWASTAPPPASLRRTTAAAPGSTRAHIGANVSSVGRPVSASSTPSPSRSVPSERGTGAGDGGSPGARASLI